MKIIAATQRKFKKRKKKEGYMALFKWVTKKSSGVIVRMSALYTFSIVGFFFLQIRGGWPRKPNRTFIFR